MKKYYENANAKTNCPECDSINTFYKGTILICNNCKAETDMRLSKKVKKLFGIVGVATVLLTIIFLTI